MKTYTVKDVAFYLKVNEETVRRWIRSKKLVASWDSKKEGCIIEEFSLIAFLSKYPKYAARFTTISELEQENITHLRLNRLAQIEIEIYKLQKEKLEILESLT